MLSSIADEVSLVNLKASENVKSNSLSTVKMIGTRDSEHSKIHFLNGHKATRCGSRLEKISTILIFQSFPCNQRIFNGIRFIDLARELTVELSFTAVDNVQ